MHRPSACHNNKQNWHPTVLFFHTVFSWVIYHRHWVLLIGHYYWTVPSSLTCIDCFLSPGIILTWCLHCLSDFSQPTHIIAIFIIIHFQNKKLGLGEVRKFAQIYAASTWRRKDQSSAMSDPWTWALNHNDVPPQIYAIMSNGALNIFGESPFDMTCLEKCEPMAKLISYITSLLCPQL